MTVSCMKKLIILGAGGYGQTVADIAEQLGCEVTFLDDNSDKAIDVCANFEKYKTENTFFYPAFGNNEGRINWLKRLEEAGCVIPALIPPTAYVSPTAVIEAGTTVLPGAIVNTSCKIGRGCIINCGAIIDHGCVLEDGVHVCLGAVVKGDNHIPRCMKVEAGQVITNGFYK